MRELKDAACDTHTQLLSINAIASHNSLSSLSLRLQSRSTTVLSSANVAETFRALSKKFSGKDGPAPYKKLAPYAYRPTVIFSFTVT